VPSRDADEFTTMLLNADTPSRSVQICQAILRSDRVPAGLTRAEVLTELGEHLAMAGQAQKAGEAFRAALADGGATTIDPRCLLAKWCLEYGDPAEGAELLRQLWAERRRDIPVCVFVGEMYERRGEHAAAIRWLTSGATHAEQHFREEEPVEIVRLLVARRRVRRANGFCDDDLDELAGEMQLRLFNLMATVA
jgi:hypothetical protein